MNVRISGVCWRQTRWLSGWDFRWSTVNVDLSTVLKPEQDYSVYNCEDIRQTIGQAKPVATGAYDGKPLPLPMRRSPECPEFDAFLVLPVTANQ